MDLADLRFVMVAESNDDGEAAMAAFFLGLSCLNEGEFAIAAPALNMTPEVHNGLGYLVDQLGGPEGMASTIGTGDESGFMELFGTAMECGLDMEGAGPAPEG